jgi:UDP-glucose 4-epimerase
MSSMKMLIFGGAGYIGGVTAHMAVQAGHDVTVVDNLSTGRKHNVPQKAKFVKGDSTDRAFINNLFAADNYDTVMHFAGKILVPESMKQPYDYFRNNVFGALNVIDAAARQKSHYIFSSSAATYGEPKQIPLTEKAAANPVNPYGWSKVLTEQLLRSYQITDHLQWVALRYFNVAGAYDGVGTDYPFVSHIIPSLLASMAAKKPIVIYGKDYDTPDGTCVRDYVHVADIAKAHLMAAEAMQKGTKLNQPINLGSQHGYSVKQVADTFNAVTGAALPIEYYSDRPGDPAQLVAGNELAKKMLGWQPELGLQKIIKDHFDWYKAQTNPNAPITEA